MDKNWRERKGAVDLYHIGGNTYSILKDHKNGWNYEVFRERYSEVLDRYDYIVGDWGYNQLRLKGFFKETNNKGAKDASIALLHDYLNEYCNFGCAYFIIEKLASRKGQPDREDCEEIDPDAAWKAYEAEKSKDPDFKPRQHYHRHQEPRYRTGAEKAVVSAAAPSEGGRSRNQENSRVKEQDRSPRQSQERGQERTQERGHERNQERDQERGQGRNAGRDGRSRGPEGSRGGRERGREQEGARDGENKVREGGQQSRGRSHQNQSGQQSDKGKGQHPPRSRHNEHNKNKDKERNRERDRDKEKAEPLA